MQWAPLLPALAGLVLLGSILNTETTPQTRTTSDIKAGTYSDTYVHGTTTYSYTTHVPEPPLDEKMPLLLVFPGGGDTATETMQETHFDTLADKERFIVTYITNSEFHWSDIQKDSGAVKIKSAYIAFLPAFIDSLSKTLPINTTRIYGAGFSSGSLYIQEMACRTGIFAAIAPVSGGSALSHPCTKTPVVFWHETDRQNQFINPPWIHINECDSVKIQRSMPTISAETAVSMREFAGCEEGADVSVYNVHGGAHKWPDMSLMQSADISSITPEQIMWNFMSKYTNTK